MNGETDKHSETAIVSASALVQPDESGRRFFEHPFTGKRVYCDEVSGHSVTFTPLSKEDKPEQCEYHICVDQPKKTTAPDGRLFFGTDRDKRATVTLIAKDGEWRLLNYELLKREYETSEFETKDEFPMA